MGDEGPKEVIVESNTSPAGACCAVSSKASTQPTPVAAKNCVSLGIQHPLAPLSKDEIVRATQIVRDAEEKESAVEKLRFESVSLAEPDRSAARQFCAVDGSEMMERCASVNVYRAGKVGCLRYTVSLSDGSVKEKEVFPTARPMIQKEEHEAVIEAMKTNPDFIKCLAKRGITDLSLVEVEPWPAGIATTPEEEGRHIVNPFVWVRGFPRDNHYGTYTFTYTHTHTHTHTRMKADLIL